MNKLTITSLFAGAGGLDLGFERAGFRTIWANEFDGHIWQTYEENFSETTLDKRSITDIPVNEIPDADGIIGGPPCQSWSNAGKGRGLKDKRGQLFRTYIEIIKVKQPKFFLCENVAGIVSTRHIDSFIEFLRDFESAGYAVSWKLIDANSYDVPQSRKRVIIVGYRKDLGKQFQFPDPQGKYPTLRDAIGDLAEAIPAKEHNHPNEALEMPNHEYFVGKFSSRYMQANRVRSWDEPSYTIVATANSAPIHPKVPKMVKVAKQDFIFDPKYEAECRRLSIRECARVQTFPDDFVFRYKNLVHGYKMVGNAVPVRLAEIIAKQIYDDLSSVKSDSALSRMIEANEGDTICLPDNNNTGRKE